MKDQIMNFLHKAKEIWTGLSKKTKGWIIGGGIATLVAIILIVTLTSIKHYSPLYSNLSTSEAGQIKANLDSKHVPYQLSNGGTTISVPSDQVNQLKLDLAAAGIPKSGQIDYSFFGQNASFGMTDKQFTVLERAAMQTELANLITQIKGVKAAKVMLNLPQNSVWVSDQNNSQNQASASVVLQLDPGYQLDNSQVQGLYHLVAKSVPNLSEDNIVIMDQYFNYYNKKNNANDSTLSAYDQQKQIKDDIEKELRQRVQQMLGMMMGQDKVMVNVSTNIDFTKTKSSEDLVQPVNKQTMQGLQVSAENISETYTGSGASGQVGTGSTSIPGYPAGSSGNGNYKRVDNKVNYAFNKIHKTIVNSPYTINDMGIQVMVEPPNPNKPSSLSSKNINSIKQILNTIVRTTLANNGGSQLTPSQVSQKSVVTVEKFNGKVQTPQLPTQSIPLWVYILGGVLLLIIIALIIFLLRRRKKVEEKVDLAYQPTAHVTNLEENNKSVTEEVQKYKQLESMAKQRPEEFVKLLRTWLSED